MSDITSANVATAIIKMIAADALPALIGNLVMGNLVNRNYESVIANAGDTVNVPIAPNLTANNIAEGSTVTLQAQSIGNAQIVLNTHSEATVQITDIAAALATPNLMKMYIDSGVKALAQAIETALLNTWSQFSANAPVGTGGTAITEAVVDLAETQLFNSFVPPNAEKYLVVNPTTYSSLRQIGRFSTWSSTADAGVKAITNGEVLKVKDFNVFRSQYVPQTGSGTITTHNLAFSRDAIGMAIRRLPQPLPGTGAISEYVEMGNFGMRVTMSYQPNTLAQQFTVDCLYGIGVLRNGFGQQVNS